MADSFEALFAGMTPEERQQAISQIVGLSGLSQEDELLQQQLARAEAMGAPSGRQYSTAIGAALGGAGDLIAGISSAKRAGDIGKQRKGLIDKGTAARERYAQLVGRPAPAPEQEEPFYVGPDEVGPDGVPFYLRRR